MLAILRWVMVVIFVSFGMQKFTPQSAQGIAQFITNSPFISWLSVFGLRGEAYFLGVAEFVIAALLVAGAFNPFLSALGSLLGVVTFAITWSFFFTTPGVVKWSLSTDPMAWNLAGEFLFKDIVLLCVCAVLFSRVIAATRDSATQIDFVYRPNLETDKFDRAAVTAAAPSLAQVEAQAIVAPRDIRVSYSLVFSFIIISRISSCDLPGYSILRAMKRV